MDRIHSQIYQPSTCIAQHEGDTLSDNKSPLAKMELSPCGQVEEDKTTVVSYRVPPAFFHAPPYPRTFSTRVVDFRTKVPRGTRVDDVTLDSIVRVDDVTLGSTRDSRDVTLVFMTSLSLALAFREFYPRIGSTWC